MERSSARALKEIESHVLGVSGNYTQIKYPVSGGKFKYAFALTSEVNRCLLGKVNSTAVSGNIQINAS